MRGESAIWGASLSVVGASFLGVAVALVVVSVQRRGEASAEPAASGVAASAEPEDPGSAGPAGGSSSAPVAEDAGVADGSAPDAGDAPAAAPAAASSGGSGAAAKPKAILPVKKPPYKGKPKKH